MFIICICVYFKYTCIAVYMIHIELMYIIYYQTSLSILREPKPSHFELLACCLCLSMFSPSHKLHAIGVPTSAASSPSLGFTLEAENVPLV